MSSSQWTVRMTGSGDDVYFSSHRILAGSLAAVRRAVVEPLDAVGVDGRKFRVVHRQAPPLVLRVIEPTTQHEVLETRLFELVGAVVTLYIKGGTSTYKFPKATVVDVRDFRRLQRLYGFGEIAGATKSLEATLIVERPNVNEDDL